MSTVPSFEAFLSAIQASGLPLDSEQQVKAAQFAVLLHEENGAQNLTRIVGVENFVEGHLIDSFELVRNPELGKRVMDIGSGCGVPGLLAAALMFHVEQMEWILVDSEASKADWLARGAAALGLKNVSVYSNRVESIIMEVKPDTVVARAVGSFEKIASWILPCSTWNNLLLFKSRGWQEEWDKGNQTKAGKKLTINHIYDYSSKERTRLLVSLSKKSK